MTDEIETPVADVPTTPAPAADTPPAPTPDPAPTDWRKEWAGDDEKLFSLLGRYSSPKDVGKAFYERNKQIDSGVYKKAIPFPADATDDVKAEWRKENGIPLSAADYKMPDGLVIGEADKPIIDEFLKSMYDGNVPDGVPQKAIEWYFKTQEAQAANQAASEAEFAKQTTQALKQEWGAEYQANYNIAQSYALETYGEVVGDIMLGLGAETVKQLANQARLINPAATIVPHSNNPTAAIADEKAELEKRMRNTESWKKDTKGQARYQEIIAYERRTAGRR